MEIRFSATAARALLRSNKRALLRENIDQLAQEPEALATNVTRLQGRDESRLRVQDWRHLPGGGRRAVDRRHRAAIIGVRGEAMTVQFLEIAGQRVAVLPVADYERLIDAAEDRADDAAARAAEARRDGGEEYLPSAIVDQLLSGVNPLKVWREYRGLSQTELAAVAGCHFSTVSHIETGRREGRQWLLQKLATALGVSVSDLISAS